MASLFKGHGKGQWLVAFVDWDPKSGRKRRREKATGTGDKATATQIAARLEEQAGLHRQEAADLVELRRRGLSDPVAERLADKSRTPIAEHLGDYRAVLEGRNNTPKYVSYVVGACEDLARECGFEAPADIDAVKVSQWIKKAKTVGVRKRGEEQDPQGLAARSINHKIAAFKGFVQWLCADGRVRSNPLVLVRKLNAAADRRVVRRALTEDEIARLLAAAEAGPPVMGMAG